LQGKGSAIKHFGAFSAALSSIVRPRFLKVGSTQPSGFAPIFPDRILGQDGQPPAPFFERAHEL
jgi:hypothetical protein